MSGASSSCPSSNRSGNQMWALQVNGEIPRAPSTPGWEQLKSSQEKLDGIIKSSTSSSGKNLRPENERQEIPEVDLDDDTTPETNIQPNSRLPTIEELNSSLPYKLPFFENSEVDLRPLLKNLLPVWEVDEDDTLWDRDSLLAEIQLKFNEERRKQRSENSH